MGNYPNVATPSKPNLPGDPGDINCPYCRSGLNYWWPGKNVFHTHDHTQELTPENRGGSRIESQGGPRASETRNGNEGWGCIRNQNFSGGGHGPPIPPPLYPPLPEKPISIDHLKDLLPDVEVTTNEVEGANKAIHTFFEGTGIDPKDQLDFDIVIFLAKLNKFKIEKPFCISEEIEMMIAHAKGGDFGQVFKILDEYPAIVNHIPPNRAWGVLHQAAFYNDFDAVKKLLENPKCDPFLMTKQALDGVLPPGTTANMIAKDPNVKNLIEKYGEDKIASLKAKSKSTLASIKNEEEIEVESILLTLNCFENVLHPKTLNSKHSLVYSHLMLDIFEFISSGRNWERARQKVALQLQSLNIYVAKFLATGNEKRDIMQPLFESRGDFYSRVIHLYTKERTIKTRYGGKSSNQFYSALNISLRTHGNGSNPSFVSGEDLAFAAYGILLNSILMYWTNLIPTNEPTYRGMDLPLEVIAEYKSKKEQTFTWLCFTSTSLSEETAKSFSGSCMFICDNTKGTKYAAKGIMIHSELEHEEEYLYPSGAKFRITNIEETNGTTTFRLLLEDY